QLGEGRHWENSMNESCSTETRLTTTYALGYAERLDARLRANVSCNKWIDRNWFLAMRSGLRKSYGCGRWLASPSESGARMLRNTLSISSCEKTRSVGMLIYCAMYDFSLD